MATTSGNPTAGTAIIVGRGGDSKGKKGRLAGLVAAVALGLGLLSGPGFGQLGHRAPSAAAAWHNPPRSVVITGETPCALGGTAPCGLVDTAPRAITGETPCPLGGTAPCGHFHNASAGITPSVVGVLTPDEAGGVYADASGVGAAQAR